MSIYVAAILTLIIAASSYFYNHAEKNKLQSNSMVTCSECDTLLGEQINRIYNAVVQLCLAMNYDSGIHTISAGALAPYLIQYPKILTQYRVYLITNNNSNLVVVAPNDSLLTSLNDDDMKFALRELKVENVENQTNIQVFVNQNCNLAPLGISSLVLSNENISDLATLCGHGIGKYVFVLLLG